MRNMGETPQNLAGSLLVAHPNLRDPNFRRSVLFVYSHDLIDGTGAVIINRPLDKQVADLVTEAPLEGLGDVPVFLGGPVGKNQLMFATFEWQEGAGLRLNHNVDVEQANERADEDPASIRAFVGYAGWSAGQLEAEMRQNAWLVQPPSPAALQTEALPKLWFDIMRGLGPWYRMLAAAPDDPSLN